MKNPTRLWALIAVTYFPVANASPPPQLCKALRSFVESVGPDEKREFTFRTSWGANFKDATEPAIAAKRCDQGGYEPAMKVCDHLIEQGSAERAGSNAKNVITCLSKTTRFAPTMNLDMGEFTFGYGTDSRGALITVTLQADERTGGMALRVTANGY